MIKHLAFIILIGICCVNTLYSQSQNIGFGTENPQARLDIVGGSGATNLLRVSNDGSAPYDNSILVDPTGK